MKLQTIASLRMVIMNRLMPNKNAFGEGFRK
jgi:hypothetical protein